ncbi:MAG: hypothetical protein WCO98_09585 [bacterium]
MSGLWDKPNIPHKGWECVDVHDLGENLEEGEAIPYQFCEMCENEGLRYIHYMKHEDYPDVIGVGSVCAQKMSDDYVDAENRERALRNIANRRKRWLNRVWKMSAKGNDYLVIDDYTLTVFPKNSRWSFSIAYPKYGMKSLGDTVFSSCTYDTKNKTKIALFNTFIKITGQV